MVNIIVAIINILNSLFFIFYLPLFPSCSPINHFKQAIKENGGNHKSKQYADSDADPKQICPCINGKGQKSGE